MSLWTRRAQSERGQATFEFFLLIPVFLLAVFLVADGGIWMYKFISVSNAVRDAARYGSVTCGGNPCTWTDVRDRAIQSSSGFLDTSDTWEIGWIDRDSDGVNNGRGDSVIVKVSSPHDLLFFPFSFDVQSCAEMRIEGPNSDGTMMAPSEC